MTPLLKQLSLEGINSSPEVQAWLAQFPANKRAAATGLLLGLRFVTRDTYSEWLKDALLNVAAAGPCAVYAVRKFGYDIQCIWDEAGDVLERPSYSLGSEDLVQAAIANVKKSQADVLLDHPSLPELKMKKVRNVALVDDSIGSGERVCSYVARMMHSKTFLSWWSHGWIRLHIMAFARTEEAATRIVASIPGSDHPKRTYPKSGKILFVGQMCYQQSLFLSRWGPGYQGILDLCDSTSEIQSDSRRGYGKTMANLVFYHSVPDNIPGVFWFDCTKWRALFPKRSVPAWLPELLEGSTAGTTQKSASSIPKYLAEVLRLIKKGVRNEHSLARSLGLDPAILKQIIAGGRTAGLLTDRNRLTQSGILVLRREGADRISSRFDRSLYVPRKWCVGRETVQPSGSDGPKSGLVQADSTGDLPAEGEAGQASLERTDARTAPPSLNVMTQDLRSLGKGHDIHGPEGPKVT